MGACVQTRNFSFFPKSVSITLQGVPKKPQTIENDLLLEFHLSQYIKMQDPDSFVSENIFFQIFLQSMRTTRDS